jgi:hypothetical protein
MLTVIKLNIVLCRVMMLIPFVIITFSIATLHTMKSESKSNVLLSVVIWLIIPNAVMLRVVMLSVLAPFFVSFNGT